MVAPLGQYAIHESRSRGRPTLSLPIFKIILIFFAKKFVIKIIIVLILYLSYCNLACIYILVTVHMFEKINLSLGVFYFHGIKLYYWESTNFGRQNYRTNNEFHESLKTTAIHHYLALSLWRWSVTTNSPAAQQSVRLKEDFNNTVVE